MLTFNHLLSIAGLDPARVQLARHQATRYGRERTPYALWRSGDGRFDFYQSQQVEGTFRPGGILASFVVTPAGETLFVGLYDVASPEPAPPGTICPVSGDDLAAAPGRRIYPLVRRTEMGNLSGLVVIEWGPGSRAWVQNTVSKGRPDKPVIEIRRTIEDPPFPGVREFKVNLADLDVLPPNWRAMLQVLRGVYLLVCRQTGKAYVGAALAGGFWARWSEYADTGHGGNIGMRAHPHADWQVTILEAAGSADQDEDILRMEAAWKAKLMSLRHGLNQN